MAYDKELTLSERGEHLLAIQVMLAARTVAPIFRMFGWEWLTANGLVVPSEGEIENQLDALVCTLLDDAELEATSTGRLYVHKDVESWDGEGKIVDIFLTLT
jgi:hypothetical protein